MLIKKKAILLINCFSKGINSFGNLYNELQFYKEFDVYNFYLFKEEKIIDNISNLMNILIRKKYREIYLIGHNIGSSITLYLANKYDKVKKIIISNPIIKEEKLNFNLSKTVEKEISKLNKECLNILSNIRCPILIIHSLNNKLCHVDNSIFIHDKIASNINYLITIKDTNNDIYISNRYKEIYKLVIDFLILKQEPNTFHLNI